MKRNPSSNTARNGSRRGFSLVELLVSITIIIVLAALVILLTGRIRSSAQQASAMTALRQLGIANAAYASENSGAINVIRDPGEWGSGFEGPGSKYASNSFVGRMQPYLFAGISGDNERTLRNDIVTAYAALFNTSDFSDMTGTPFKGVTPYKDGSGIPNPIAVNINLRPEWRRAPLQVSTAGDPSRILYLTYGRYYFDMPQVSSYTPLPKPGERVRTIYYLPNRKGIFCFLDGHVELLSPPIPERLIERPQS